MSFIDKIKKNKKKMNICRWNFNYILFPTVIMLFIIMVVLCAMIYKIDQSQLLLCIVLEFWTLINCIIILIYLHKKTTKTELEEELKKHNFDYSNLETKKYYQLNLVDVNGTQEYITFMNGKLHMFGQTYNYEDLWFYFVSDNQYKLVNLDLKIYFSDPSDINSSYMLLTLDNEMLMIIDQFDIKIENEKELKYLLNYKEDAFKQILKYSKIKKINY